jgi:CBS domain-containing protein
MSQSVYTLLDTATVQDAWKSLAQQGVGQAPVVDKNGSLVGLMSRADLMRLDQLPSPEHSALVWRAMLQQRVSDLMQTPVPAATPDADIRWVARALLDTELPGLPVVDEAGAVIGFVSRSDILRAVVTYPPLDLWG